ncbi:hypothetical protein ACFWDN_13100 [Micromonospora chalcea]
MSLMKAFLSDDPAERERYINLQTLRMMVSQRIFCAATEQVLDVRTAVAVTMRRESDGAASTWVMVGEEWDKRADTIRGIVAKEDGMTVEVIDGRAL